MDISNNCLVLVKHFEGTKLTAYPDPGTGGAPWTIGTGLTRINGLPVKSGQTITAAQADAALMAELGITATNVSRLLKVPTSQNEFDALVCFAFNVGIGNLVQSSVLARHNLGDRAGAAGAFGMWVKGGGRVLPGLVARRKAEATLYSTGRLVW